MADVLFKRGAQASLDAIQTSSIVDGAFYLTTDTDRLYIGKDVNGTKSLVELNKSITIVDSLSDLPTLISDNSKAIKGSSVADGSFYYIVNAASSIPGRTRQANILAVARVNNGEITWVQINPDTNTNDNTQVNSVSFTAPQTAVNNTLTYTININQNTSHSTGSDTAETAVTGTLVIDGSLIEDIVSVDLEAVEPQGSTDTVTIGQSGSTGVTIVGGTGINIEVNQNDEVEISADESDPVFSASPAAAITAQDIADWNNKSDFSGSYNDLTDKPSIPTAQVNSDWNANNGVAEILNKPNLAAVATSGDYDDLTNKPTIPTLFSQLTNDIGLATDNYYTSAVSADSNGVITLTQVGTSNVTSGADLYNTIKTYSSLSDTTGTTNTVYNQGSLGEFYTKAAIDDILKGLNAMTYKGSVFGTGATESALPTTGVHNGDFYIANDDSSPYKKGDMIIATGTENANGVLDAPITWVKIAGTDLNTTYHLSTTSAAATTANNYSGIKVTDTLVPGDSSCSSSLNTSYVSKSLSITSLTAQSGEDNRIAIDLEWGTF